MLANNGQFVKFKLLAKRRAKSQDVSAYHTQAIDSPANGCLDTGWNCKSHGGVQLPNSIRSMNIPLIDKDFDELFDEKWISVRLLEHDLGKLIGYGFLPQKGTDHFPRIFR